MVPRNALSLVTSSAQITIKARYTKMSDLKVSATSSLGIKGKRVAVIGAGPGGIAAGVALHQAGFSVKVFERHSELRPLGGNNS